MTAQLDYRFSDLCLDFTCEVCDTSSFLDGYAGAAGLIQCPGCHTRYQLSTSIAVRALPKRQRIKGRIVALDPSRHTH